jgi:hypothetical protein
MQRQITMPRESKTKQLTANEFGYLKAKSMLV